MLGKQCFVDQRHKLSERPQLTVSKTYADPPVNSVQCNAVKFLNYNVHGLVEKLENNHFIDFLLSHDFICLTETFIAKDFESPLFKDFFIFTAKAQKLSHHGRCSGGTIVMVRKTFKEFVKRIETETENTIILNIHKDLFSSEKNIMFIGTYLPPYKSPFWRTQEGVFGLELLEQCIVNLYETFDDFFVLISGDLNARTSSQNYSFNGDGFDFRDTTVPNDNSFARKSQDNHVSNFGEQLVEICNMFDCIILNGLVDYSFDDSCTYIGSLGESVVDYFIASCDLFLVGGIGILHDRNQCRCQDPGNSQGFGRDAGCHI